MRHCTYVLVYAPSESAMHIGALTPGLRAIPGVTADISPLTAEKRKAVMDEFKDHAEIRDTLTAASHMIRIAYDNSDSQQSALQALEDLAARYWIRWIDENMVLH